MPKGINTLLVTGDLKRGWHDSNDILRFTAVKTVRIGFVGEDCLGGEIERLHPTRDEVVPSQPQPLHFVVRHKAVDGSWGFKFPLLQLIELNELHTSLHLFKLLTQALTRRHEGGMLDCHLTMLRCTLIETRIDSYGSGLPHRVQIPDIYDSPYLSAWDLIKSLAEELTDS